MVNSFKIINLIAMVWLVFTLLTACSSSGSNEPSESASASSFSYPVRVQTIKGKEIPNADVTIDVAQKAPLNDVTDSTGYARIFIDSSYIGKPGKLIVNADGYERDVQNIDLVDGTLPDIIQLELVPPTPTSMPTDTPEPTPTHEPTSTSTLEPTPTPTDEPPPPTPTVTQATPTISPQSTIDPKFYWLSLSQIANESTENGYKSPPQGLVELEGVPFDFPTGQNSATTQAETLPNFPLVLQLDSNIFAPEKVHLLITGGNTFTRFSGRIIGKIRLSFVQGDPYEIDLIAGQNIREWKLLDEQTVSKISSEQVVEVWRTESNFGGVGVIDMLTIDLPAEYRSDYLIPLKCSTLLLKLWVVWTPP